MTPLQRTLKYRSMIRKGETPNTLQNKLNTFAKQQEHNVVNLLKQREENVEKVVLDFFNQVKNLEDLEYADNSLKKVKQTTESIQKEVVEVLFEQLAEKKRVLQLQRQQKEIVSRAITAYRQALKEPSETDKFIAEAGKRICHKLKD